MRGQLVDERPTGDVRLVDNPYRRESHRPWYGRRGPRWVVALSVIALFALNAFAFKKIGTRTDPITVDTAVARFRSRSGTQPAVSATATTNLSAGDVAGAPAANGDSAPDNNNERGGGARPKTADPVADTTADAGAASGPTPAPGVYVYDSNGFEQADVLGGARHDYPSTTTMTVTSSDCGVDVRWTPIEQRFDDWDMCVDGAAIHLRTYTTHHEFFGQTEEHKFNCTGVDIRPAAHDLGTVTTGTCEDTNGANHAHTKTTVLGPDTVVVQGVAVPALKLHLEQYLSGDMNGSEISDLWLRPSDGLLMRWSSVIEAKGKTVFGQTHFHEEDNVSISDLTPRQ